MLQPKKFKYKKQFKIINQTIKKESIIFGEFALKSLENNEITNKQLDSLKKTINKKLKKLGFLWIRIFPNNSITKKPSEVRMGKGKGNVYLWSNFVNKGTILCEINGVSKELALKALNAGSKKLALKTKIISKGL